MAASDPYKIVPVLAVAVAVWFTPCILLVEADVQHYYRVAGERAATAPNCSECRLVFNDTSQGGSINLKFIKLENENFYQKNKYKFFFRDGCGGSSTNTTLPSKDFLKTPFRLKSVVEFQFQRSCVILEVIPSSNLSHGFEIRYTTTNNPMQDMMFVVADNNKIYAVDLLRVDAFKGASPRPMNPGGSGMNISAMAFYPPTKTLYIANGTRRAISRYNVTGWDQSISFVDDIINGTGDVSSLVIDPDHGDLYWSDAAYNSINSSRLDGSSQQSILTKLRSPRNLVFDHVGRYLYWINDGDNRTVEGAMIDGSRRLTCSNKPDAIAYSSQVTDNDGTMIHLWATFPSADDSTMSVLAGCSSERGLHWFEAGPTIGEYVIRSHSCRTPPYNETEREDRILFTAREGTFLWAQKQWVYGAPIADKHPGVFNPPGFNLGMLIKLLLFSKFSENPSLYGTVTELHTTETQTTDTQTTGTQTPETHPYNPPLLTVTSTTSVELPRSGSSSSKSSPDSLAVYKYVFVTTTVVSVFCALIVAALVVSRCYRTENHDLPVCKSPDMYPLSTVSASLPTSKSSSSSGSEEEVLSTQSTMYFIH